MGIFSKKNRHDDIDKATDFVMSQRESGLVRHYTVENVQECVGHFTGVHLSEQEAKDVVNRVRSENGWGSADYLDEKRPSWWQKLTGNY